MAVRGKSSADRTARWEVLVDNLTPELPAMPHVAENLKALEDKLARARTLLSQQEDLRSQARGIQAELKVLLKEGDELRARLGQSLKGRFGPTAPALARFSFKPRPEKLRRRKAEPEPAPNPAAPAPPGAAAAEASPTAVKPQ